MIQNEDIISEESKLANLFSNFFENAVYLLGIIKEEQRNEIYVLTNSVEIAIKKFDEHRSIKLILIKENKSNTTTFSFMLAEIADIIKEISNIDKKLMVLLKICLHGN